LNDKYSCRILLVEKKNNAGSEEHIDLERESHFGIEYCKTPLPEDKKGHLA
jgi:hypothetical protein